jgi:serine/threonine protein kinase
MLSFNELINLKSIETETFDNEKFSLFNSFTLQSDYNKKQLYLLIEDKTNFLIYNCLLESYGTFNNIYKIFECYHTKFFHSFKITNMKDINFSYLEDTIIENKIYTTLYDNKHGSEILRISKIDKDTDQNDIKFENILNYCLSKTLQDETDSKFHHVILQPSKILFINENKQFGAILPRKQLFEDFFISFIAKDMNNYLLKENRRYYDKTTLNIYLLFQKIINKLKLLAKFNFIHGDLKINNIVFDLKEKKNKDIDIYLIDLGNSYLEYDKTQICSSFFTEFINKNDEKPNYLLDFSFFVISLYIHIDHYMNPKIYKDSKYVVDKNFLQLFNQIYENEIIQKFYDESKILSKLEIIESQKKDGWSIYINYLGEKEKKNLSSNIYRYIKNCYNMKISIRDDVFEFIDEKIKKLTKKLKIK